MGYDYSGANANKEEKNEFLMCQVLVKRYSQTKQNCYNFAFIFVVFYALGNCWSDSHPIFGKKNYFGFGYRIFIQRMAIPSSVWMTKKSSSYISKGRGFEEIYAPFIWWKKHCQDSYSKYEDKLHWKSNQCCTLLANI